MTVIKAYNINRRNHDHSVRPLKTSRTLCATNAVGKLPVMADGLMVWPRQLRAVICFGKLSSRANFSMLHGITKVIKLKQEISIMQHASPLGPSNRAYIYAYPRLRFCLSCALKLYGEKVVVASIIAQQNYRR
jgi:hypothetical protein